MRDPNKIISVGMHYKVTWHWKASDEVASAHMNTYIEIPADTEDHRTLTLMREAVEKEVELHYPENKHNIRIEMKKFVHPEGKGASYEGIIYIGDQTEINKNL